MWCEPQRDGAAPQPGPFDGLFDFFSNVCKIPTREAGIGSVGVAQQLAAEENEQKLKDLGLTDQDLEAVFNKFDANRSGFLEKAEGRALVTDILKQSDANYQPAEEDLDLMFRAFDENNDGKIDKLEFKKAMRTLIPRKFGKKALVIVDLQNDFINGSLAVTDSMVAVKNTNELRKKFDIVFLTRDWHPADHCSFWDNHPGAEMFSVKKLKLPDGNEVDQVMWPRHCVQGSNGAKFHPDVKILSSDHVIDKGMNTEVDSYSGFFDNMKGHETVLRAKLRALDVSEVYVVGLAYDFCVGSTAIDAASTGFTSYLVEDCAKHVAEDSRKDMNRRLKENGVIQIQSSQVPMSPKPSWGYTLEVAKSMLKSRGQAV